MYPPAHGTHITLSVKMGEGLQRKVSQRTDEVGSMDVGVKMEIGGEVCDSAMKDTQAVEYLYLKGAVTVETAVGVMIPVYAANAVNMANVASCDSCARVSKTGSVSTAVGVWSASNAWTQLLLYLDPLERQRRPQHLRRTPSPC